jgi:hypothetical protein
MATRLPPPARFAGALRYERTDIPAELTLTEWRNPRHRALPSPGRRWRLLRRLLGHR